MLAHVKANGKEMYVAVYHGGEVLTMEEKLNPCPFCGGKGNFINFDSSIFWVQCANCGSQGMQCETKTEAIEAWNRRTENKQCKLVDICRLYAEWEG